MQQNGDVPTYYLLGYGRIIGFLALFTLFVITLTGFSPNARSKISKLFRLKKPQSFHCLFAFLIILFALFHAVFLIRSHYAWNATPNLFGITALLIFGIIALTSFYRSKILPQIELKQWKRFHLLLAIAMLLILLYKIITFGGHFS
ncbi:MAG: hypothetical protein JSV49_08175 [Thermoplasmata archaeon]|nr:MAG: hypothetical protein JSV49_08175 [Thermoplasmata archaeon]